MIHHMEIILLTGQLYVGKIVCTVQNWGFALLLKRKQISRMSTCRKQRGIRSGVCGKLHFQAVSEQVRFDWVNSYEDFRQKFGVAESE